MNATAAVHTLCTAVGLSERPAPRSPYSLTGPRNAPPPGPPAPHSTLTLNAQCFSLRRSVCIIICMCILHVLFSPSLTTLYLVLLLLCASDCVCDTWCVPRVWCWCDTHTHTTYSINTKTKHTYIYKIPLTYNIYTTLKLIIKSLTLKT